MSTLFEADLKGGADPEMELDHLESDPEFETLQSLESYPNLEGETWQEQEGMAEPEYGLQEFEDEVDLEDQEFSLGGLFKRVASAVRRASPRLRQLASRALPMVAGAVGGPLGGVLGSAAARALGEGEFEGDHEADQFLDQEEASTRIPSYEALAEYLASVAANAESEPEADAMSAAAAVATLSAADRHALKDVLPHLVRGVAVLTRVLRGSPETRTVVRVIPAIVRRSVKLLRRQKAAGQTLKRPMAARALVTQTRAVLQNPQRCAKAIAKNVRAARASLRTQAGRPAAAGRRPRGQRPPL